MKRYNIIFILILFISCKNTPVKISHQDLSNDSITFTSKELIDPILREGIKRFLKSPKFLQEHPDILLSESCLNLWTLVNIDESSIHFSDSLIELTYFVDSFNIKEYDFYKGILIVDGINVAILDYGNFIEGYINMDSLIQIPLNTFKCYSTNIILMDEFYLKNGELIYRTPSIIVP